MSREPNGLNTILCPVATSWDDHRDDTRLTIKKVDEMHSNQMLIIENMQYLKKLDKLDIIAESLLSAATGKDHLEVKTARLIFGILAAVIGGLMFVIVFLLTGQKFGIFNLH